MHLNNHSEKHNVWYFCMRKKWVILPQCRKFPMCQSNFAISSAGLFDKTFVAGQIWRRSDVEKFPEGVTNQISNSSKWFSFVFFFLFFWESMSGVVGGRETGRHRMGSRLQAPSCQHRARRRAQTHGPRDRDLSRSRMLNRLNHPGAPSKWFSI